MPGYKENLSGCWTTFDNHVKVLVKAVAGEVGASLTQGSVEAGKVGTTRRQKRLQGKEIRGQ